MDDATINSWVKRLILEEQFRQIGDAILTLTKTDAINLLAQNLVGASPETFEKKISLANGGTNVFALPSDCLMLKNVWDYGGNVGTVSGAADNGSGLIRITHNIVIPDNPSTMVFPFIFPFGFAEDYDNTVVTIHSVSGCTEANGTWRAVYVDSTHIDLYGSTFTNAYTSGGKIWIECPATYANPVDRKPSRHENADENTTYFNRQDDIVVDDPTFWNDIIILYRYLPSTLTEIPARFHYGIYAYCVLMLAKIPPRTNKQGDQFIENPAYETLRKNVDMCKSLWEMAMNQASAYKPIKHTNNLSDRKSVKRWI